MERYSKWLTLMSATLFFFLFHTTACVDEQEIGEVHGGLVFMEMTVPGLEIPTVTRSMEGNKGGSRGEDNRFADLRQVDACQTDPTY
ncbi:hypothetical protein [Parabacteroides faecis]|uniref:hypothetical protein n=1 Tax=Parabacteroides faecis TaxID=1217282 RepID=UPI0021650C6D|nr:hypothetical protein [Parabacteroides faecis]MCS2894649.1 hypothetical protein [Parabacteroides faecis]